MARKAGLKRVLLQTIVAVGASVAALLLRLAMGHVGEQLPTYITFYPAVMLVAILAGFWPGLLTTAASALLTDYWILPPQKDFHIANTADGVGLALFSAMGLFMCLVAERSRRNRQKAAAYEKELAVQASKMRYSDLVELSPLAVIVNRRTFVDFVNPAACQLFGAASPEQLCGKAVLDLFHPDCHALVQQRIQDMLEGKRVSLIEEQIVRMDGAIRQVEVVGAPFSDESGPAIQVILRDITERKQREAQLQKFTRTLKALNNSNQALLRATEEGALLQQVCRIVTEDCGHAMVWIGFAEDDEHKTVRPVASAGFEDGYLETLQVTWADTERGRGPTGTAIRTGQPCECRNMLTDPNFAPWREQALKRGYACSLVIPLLSDGKAFGAITIYSKEPDAFTEDEITLLKELAGDLAYGIIALRLRAGKERAEAAIRESRRENEFLAGIIQLSSQPFGVGYPDGRLGLFNAAFAQLTGYTAEELRSLDWTNTLTPPEWLEIERQKLEELRQTGLPVRYEKEYRRKDGVRVPIELLVHLVSDADGKPEYYYSFLTDITERKRVEAELQKASEQRRLALEAAELGTWDLRLDTGKVFWDAPCRNLFGFPAGEQIDYTEAISRIPLEDRAATDEAVKLAIAGAQGGAYHREFRVVWPDESVHWVASHGRVYFEGEGDRRRAVRFIGVNMDITERKRMVDELRQNQEWLRVTLSSIGDAVMTSDEAGRVTFLNPVAEALTGWKMEEALGQPMQRVFRIINEKTGEPAADIVAQVLRERRTHALANHTALLTRDGREFPIEDSAAPIMDSSGNVSGVVLVFHEVTERRRAQNALRQSNSVLKSFNTILEEALNYETTEEMGQTCLREIIQLTESQFGFVGEIGPDGMLHDIATSDVSEYCKVYDANGERRPPSTFKIHGLYGRVLLDGRSLLTNAPAEHPDSIGTPPGHPLLSAFLGVPLIDGGRTIGMIAVGNRPLGYRLEDQAALESLAPAVVESLRRTRAEQALRSNEARLRLALDSANSGTWEWDLKTNQNTWSDELWPLYGLAPYSCEPSYEAWLSIVHPEDRAMAERTVREVAAAGDNLDLEFRVLDGNGTVRWLMTRGRCVRDTSDHPVRYVGIAMDITARKRAEAALMQSEKLASVGRVAVTIAHEINNPLAAVMNTLYLARSSADAPPSVQRYLEVADEELRRVSLITHQALGFYRESSAPVSVPIGAILDSAMDLLQSRIKAKGASIEKQYEPGLQVTAVAGELRQVFSNLLANSLDAIGDQGTIKLRARAVRSPKNGRRYLRITVADNGTGVDRSIRSRIFEALFTTKDAVGTGLGLWVSKQIVDKHGGAIRVRSNTSGPRRGAVFSILIPADGLGAGREKDAEGQAAGR